MTEQEQNVSENEAQKASINLMVKVKSLIIKLFIVALLGGAGYFVYTHPQVLDKIKFDKNDEQAANEALMLQVNQLQNQLASLQAQVLNQPAPDLSVFENKVASLEKQNLNVIDSKADAAIVLGMLTRVDKLENRVDRLAKISDDGALILSAAMLVKQAAAEGDDFIYEAEILNQLADNASAIKKDVSVISEYSRNGVVSEVELVRQFNRIYSTSQREEKIDAKDWKERLNNKINEYIKINKVGEGAVKSADNSTLDEVAVLVNDGKLAKAVKLIESSDSDDIKQNQLLQAWLADAQNTVTFNRAIRNIAAYCLAEMKVNNLKNKE